MENEVILQGVKLPDNKIGTFGEIRYTEEQELTEQQKKQARKNIGAASEKDLNSLSNGIITSEIETDLLRIGEAGSGEGVDIYYGVDDEQPKLTLTHSTLKETPIILRGVEYPKNEYDAVNKGLLEFYISEQLCLPIEESGTIVTCEPFKGAFLWVDSNETVQHLGKNLIPQPYNNNTKINGITFDVNEDYSITIDGTSTAVTTFLFLGRGTGLRAQRAAEVGIFEGETYTISSGRILPEGITLNVYFYNAEGEYLPGSVTSAVDKSFTPGSGTEYIYAFLRINSDVVIKNFTIRPMIEHGNMATGYEPYHKEEIGDTGIVPYTGTNTFFAAGDEITVVGKKDPIKVIENLISAIIALGGNV